MERLDLLFSENNDNQYTPAEEFEIQRQQSYSGFGEKIQTNVDQRPFQQQEDLQTKRQPLVSENSREQTNTSPSYQEVDTEPTEPNPSSPQQQIKVW